MAHPYDGPLFSKKYNTNSNYMNKFLPLLLALILASCSSIKITEETNYSTYLRNDKMIINQDSLLHTKEKIKKYHPNIFNSISEIAFDSLIVEIAKTFPKEPIKETEYIYQYRKAFDTLTYGDPHFLIYPQLRRYPEYKLKGRHIRVWPFNMTCINDSLIVDQSLTPKLKKGDLLLAINNKSASEIIKYTYQQRYQDAPITQVQNHFCFAPSYQVTFSRNGQKHKVKVQGVPLHKYHFHEEYYPEKIYEEFRTGYFGIRNFDNNKYMIKRLEKFIKKLQSKNYPNLIIDVRKNPGGNGDRFDELISLFTDKDSIPFQRNTRVKVSEATQYYNFPEDSIGKVCNLPDNELIRNCPLIPDKYPGKMNIYVLISKYTASTASSFANIIQFNELGILVGEPLAYNALKYGEVTTGKLNHSIIVLSTIEIDEYSKQKDGIISPDIQIPYNAKDHMKGGDPILEKTLNIIQTKFNVTNR